MKFIGIDLGWQSGPSGLSCLELKADALKLTHLDRKDTLEQVLDWVDAIVPNSSSPTPAIIAIDAPLRISNQTGIRLADRQAHKHFGKHHAGCYPVSLNSPFATKLVQFSQTLEQRGFSHAPTITARKLGRYQIEVFPHPASIQLFQLSQILKYKKGRLAQRAAALSQLKTLILSELPKQEPALVIAQLPSIPTTGKALKAAEDKLDSILCAYIAAHWWYWGERRNGVLGDRTSNDTSYIIVPSPSQAPVSLISESNNSVKQHL